MTDHEDHREEAVETMDEGTAVLSNIGGFTTFTYGDTSIFFRAPYSLLRYIAVKEWNMGYIVADAMYSHSCEPVEEYIDLMPVLEDLGVEAESFLRAISRVTVSDGRHRY